MFFSLNFPSGLQKISWLRILSETKPFIHIYLGLISGHMTLCEWTCFDTTMSVSTMVSSTPALHCRSLKLQPHDFMRVLLHAGCIIWPVCSWRLTCSLEPTSAWIWSRSYNPEHVVAATLHGDARSRCDQMGLLVGITPKPEHRKNRLVTWAGGWVGGGTWAIWSVLLKVTRCANFQPSSSIGAFA